MKYRNLVKWAGLLAMVLTVTIGFGDFASSVDAKPQKQSVTMKTSTIGKVKYYLVNDENDLRAIGKGNYPLSANYMLNHDIKLTKEWVPIGSEEHPFTGKFEGDGHVIDKLHIKSGKVKYAGLFGWVEGATIHNVTLTHLNISAKAGGAKKSAGAIVAIALDSKVSDCTIKK
ncbi:hypothetical protein ACFQ3W_01075 [Paenibacillus puldeungensis]|uniref:Uncharacterized protein n=1 Tax=Paenibacillus puldeungensis TaxID=696536 RepID=A0ABW3RR05_9BACL